MMTRQAGRTRRTRTGNSGTVGASEGVRSRCQLHGGGPPPLSASRDQRVFPPGPSTSALAGAGRRPFALLLFLTGLRAQPRRCRLLWLRAQPPPCQRFTPRQAEAAEGHRPSPLILAAPSRTARLLKASADARRVAPACQVPVL